MLTEGGNRRPYQQLGVTSEVILARDRVYTHLPRNPRAVERTRPIHDREGISPERVD